MPRGRPSFQIASFGCRYGEARGWLKFSTRCSQAGLHGPDTESSVPVLRPGTAERRESSCFQKNVHVLAGDGVTPRIDDFRGREYTSLAIVGGELEGAMVQVKEHPQTQVGEQLAFLADSGRDDPFFDQVKMDRLSIHASHDDLA